MRQERAAVPQARIVQPAFEALREQAALISQQIAQARDRRSLIENDLKTAGNAEARQLNLRLRTVDQELNTLEEALSRVNTQIAQSVIGSPTPQPAGSPVVEVPRVPPAPPQGSDGAERIAGVLSFFVLAPLAIALAFRIARRGNAPRRAESAETNDRLNRIENAVEAIAIEVERISENQRFLTNTLASDLGSLPAPQREAEPIRRHTTPV